MYGTPMNNVLKACYEISEVKSDVRASCKKTNKIICYSYSWYLVSVWINSMAIEIAKKRNHCPRPNPQNN